MSASARPPNAPADGARRRSSCSPRPPGIAPRRSPQTCRLNDRRQTTERRIADEAARRSAAGMARGDGRAIVLDDPSWHRGWWGSRAPAWWKLRPPTVLLQRTADVRGLGSLIAGYDLHGGVESRRPVTYGDAMRGTDPACDRVEALPGGVRARCARLSEDDLGPGPVRRGVRAGGAGRTNGVVAKRATVRPGIPGPGAGAGVRLTQPRSLHRRNLLPHGAGRSVGADGLKFGPQASVFRAGASVDPCLSPDQRLER